MLKAPNQNPAYLGPKLKVGGALGRAQAGGANDRKALEAAAKEFESLLLHEMIKAMRKTVPEGGLTEQSFGRKVFTEMQDEKMAQAMAGTGGIGLHRILVEQLGANVPKEATAGPGRLIHPLGDHKHRVSSEFGPRKHPIHGGHRMHAGVDMAAATGTPVLAARGGVVTHAGRMGGYGLMIEMEYADGMATRYAHLDRLDVDLGDEIRRGVRIGAVGSTGATTGPHLHFEVRVDGEPSDPSKHLAARALR